jgi:SAM-dependent methyltransferase
MSIDTAELPVLSRLDARIPQWSLGKLEFRLCPFCRRSNRPVLLRPDRLPVAYCDACALWYVSAIPPVEEVDKLYQGYWFSFRPKELSSAYAARLEADEGLLEDDPRLNRLATISRGLKGRSLLEIGCGCGELLVAARRRGASVFGNDISGEACSFVEKLLRIPVFGGPLAGPAFVDRFGQMEIVVMSDLIEHPVEPLATFQSAWDVLRPGGLLLILTPNGGDAIPDRQHARSATGWIGFRKDLEHLQYLSSGTISLLSRIYGCRIEHFETFGFPALDGIGRLPGTPLGDSLKNALKVQLRKSRLARKLVRASRVFGGADPRRGSYILMTILRKPED